MDTQPANSALHRSALLHLATIAYGAAVTTMKSTMVGVAKLWGGKIICQDGKKETPRLLCFFPSTSVSSVGKKKECLETSGLSSGERKDRTIHKLWSRQRSHYQAAQLYQGVNGGIPSLLHLFIQGWK